MRNFLILLVPTLLLTGCSLLASPPPRAAEYELTWPGGSAETGVGVTANRAAAVVCAAGPPVLEVVAPSWLQSRAMAYRLQYQEEQRRRYYSQSRWVAEPAEMIALALQRRLDQPTGAAGSRDGARNTELTPGGDRLQATSCRVRLYLDELVQVFANEQESYVLWEVRAESVNGAPAAAPQLPSRHFTIRQPAPTPDAAGAATAHRQALEKLTQELAIWLTTPSSL